MSQNDEHTILRQVIDGFLAGESEQYRMLKTRITQYVHIQYRGDALNKEDIVSDIMEIVFRNLKASAFHGDSLKALEVYIYSIVKNTLLNRAKKSGRLRFYSDSPEVADSYAGKIDQRLLSKDLSDRILAALDESCRELLEMKFRQELADQEIADHYGRTKNAVSTAISRCIKKAKNLGILADMS
ncbi:MAG: sigma-70 family RNA polymerase sigma factor [bacterium]